MKKKILVGLAVVFLLGVLVFNTLSTYAEGTPDADGGTSYYDRYDYQCTFLPKEKTICNAGGSQLCAPQYCQ